MEYVDANQHNGDWGNSDYPWDPPLSQVNFAGAEINYPPIEIEFCDIGGWDTDIEVGDYFVNRSAPEDYRDSDRSVYRGVLSVRENGFDQKVQRKSKRAVNGLGRIQENANKFNNSQKPRFRNSDRWNVHEEGMRKQMEKCVCILNM